jgi:hypothetical protein
MAADLPATGLLVLANTGLGHQAPHHGQVAVNGSCSTHLLALARGLFTALSIALIWTAKTLKTTPRPKRKGGSVIKNYYFWS